MDGNLLGVIVGGVIAIAAGAVGPLIQHTLAAKERKAEAKRQSTLDVIEAIFRHNEYTDNYRKKMIFGEEIALTLDPLAQIEGLVSVDFPHCHEELSKFRLAGTRVTAWAINLGQKRLAGEVVTLEDWPETINGYVLASSNLIAAITGRKQITDEGLASFKAAQQGKLQDDATEAISAR